MFAKVKLIEAFVGASIDFHNSPYIYVCCKHPSRFSSDFTPGLSFFAPYFLPVASEAFQVLGYLSPGLFTVVKLTLVNLVLVECSDTPLRWFLPDSTSMRPYS